MSNPLTVRSSTQDRLKHLYEEKGRNTTQKSLTKTHQQVCFFLGFKNKQKKLKDNKRKLAPSREAKTERFHVNYS